MSGVGGVRGSRGAGAAPRGGQTLAVLSGAAAAVIVGSSAAVSATLTRYPVLTGQALRYGMAAVILCAVAWRAGRREPTPPARLGRRDVLCLLALAATGLAGFNVCLVGALRHASPAAVGSVVGATPVVLAATGPLLARRRPSGRLLLAATVVVGGAALTQGLGGGRLLGLAYALGALGGEVAFSLLAVGLLPLLGPLRLSARLTLVATPMLAVTALLTGGRSALAWPSAREAAALVYLAVVVTAVAFLLWYASLSRLGPARGGLLIGLMPVSAALAGPVLGTGALTPGALFGSVLVGAGVCLGLLPGRSAPAAGREVASAGAGARSVVAEPAASSAGGSPGQ